MAVEVKVGTHGRWQKMTRGEAIKVQKEFGAKTVEIKLSGNSTNMINKEKEAEKKKMGFGSSCRF